jgi:hypothetical protein
LPITVTRQISFDCGVSTLPLPSHFPFCTNQVLEKEKIGTSDARIGALAQRPNNGRRIEAASAALSQDDARASIVNHEPWLCFSMRLPFRPVKGPGHMFPPACGEQACVVYSSDRMHLRQEEWMNRALAHNRGPFHPLVQQRKDLFWASIRLRRCGVHV